MICYYLNVQFQGQRLKKRCDSSDPCETYDSNKWKLALKLRPTHVCMIVNHHQFLDWRTATCSHLLCNLAHSELLNQPSEEGYRNVYNGIHLSETMPVIPTLVVPIFSEFANFSSFLWMFVTFNPYPTAFPYGNGMVLHFYQQQESSTTKTVHKVINKGLKAYV